MLIRWNENSVIFATHFLQVFKRDQQLCAKLATRDPHLNQNKIDISSNNSIETAFLQPLNTHPSKW